MFIQYFFNYWWNRTFTFFFNAYNFPIFKTWKRKTFWAVLFFDGFSTSRFFLLLSFYGWAIFSWSCWNQHLVPMLDLSKLKILLQISLTRAGLFGAKILSTNHSTFPLPPPRQITPTDSPWLLSFQQAKVQRVLLTYPFSPVPLQRSVLVIRSFLMPVDSNKEGYGIDLPFILSLWHTTSQDHLFKLFSDPLQEWSRIFYEEDSPGIYSFDKVSAI